MYFVPHVQGDVTLAIRRGDSVPLTFHTVLGSLSIGQPNPHNGKHAFTDENLFTIRELCLVELEMICVIHT